MMRRLNESESQPESEGVGGGPQFEDLVRAAFEGGKVLEALVLAQRKAAGASTPEERSKAAGEYFDLLHGVVHMDEALVMTIINAGITSISERFEEEQ